MGKDENVIGVSLTEEGALALHLQETSRFFESRKGVTICQGPGTGEVIKQLLEPYFFANDEVRPKEEYSPRTCGLMLGNSDFAVCVRATIAGVEGLDRYLGTEKDLTFVVDLKKYGIWLLKGKYSFETRRGLMVLTKLK